MDDRYMNYFIIQIN